MRPKRLCRSCVNVRTCGCTGGKKRKEEKSLDRCLPLGMGAGTWAVSVEKTEKAIFRQHENTKQNFRYSIVARRVWKAARRLGSSGEQTMQRRNSSRSCVQDQATRAAPLPRGKLEKVEQQALVLNCKCGYVSSRRSYAESMDREGGGRITVSPPDTGTSWTKAWVHRALVKSTTTPGLLTSLPQVLPLSLCAPDSPHAFRGETHTNTLK